MAPQILMQDSASKAPPILGSTARSWSIFGWFGLLLALIGLGDALVNWYPLAFQSPEWEFGTIATTFGSLPLLTMGLAALAASFVARGVGWGKLTMGIVFLVLGLLVIGLLGVFATDVPLALRATVRTPGALAIRRGIIRTSILGGGFGVGYLAGAVLMFRHLKGERRV